MLCDFHIHSNFSDGQLAIPEIVDMYGRLGFGAIAITDHLCESRTFLGRAATYLDRTLNKINFQLYIEIIKSEAELAEVYSFADVFVLPSLEDNLPNMVMEALSCSTPVVAFDSGGITDMIEHKINGYLAGFMSAEDLAEGILFVLNGNSESLALHARKKITENFSYDIIAEKHINLYKRLLAQHHV